MVAFITVNVVAVGVPTAGSTETPSGPREQHSAPSPDAKCVSGKDRL